jgi:predicted PurR-regulated permease PerM
MTGDPGNQLDPSRQRDAGRSTLLGLIGAVLLGALALLGMQNRRLSREQTVPPPVGTTPGAEPARLSIAAEQPSPMPAAPRPKRIIRVTRNTERVRMPSDRFVTTRIEIPWKTIVRVVTAIALLWLFLQLWSQVVVVFIAVVLTLALDPLVARLVRRGWARGRAVMAVVLSVFALLAGLIAIIAPPLVEQGTNLADNLPEYVDDFQDVIERYPTIDNWIEAQTATEEEVDGESAGTQSNALLERVTTFVPRVLSFGAGLLSGVVSMFFLLVLTIYLLLDGPRLFETYTSKLDPVQRARMRRLRLELTSVVSGYVLGQALVSSAFGIFTFTVLTIVGAPEPLLIAVLAALLGAIPMIGATLATIPAVLLSLTVSVPTALIVLGLFLAYQQVENNVIAPRAFRNTLKISSLAVLIAVSFGSALFGVLGAMLALPVAAALPAVIRVLRAGVPIPTAEDPDLAWPSEPEHAEHGAH